MKNLKRIILGLVILQYLAFGCHNSSGRQGPVDALGSIKTDKPETLMSNANTIDQNTISPFKEVDSLVRLLNKKFAFSYLRELDKICLGSDGELTETLDGIAVDLLNNHLASFLEYLQNKPNSCLNKRVIEGLAGKYSAYEKTERLGKLQEEHLIAIAKSEKFDRKKIKFLNGLFCFVANDLDLFKDTNYR